MFTYFTANEMFINLIFPLITAILPLVLTYFLFEPIIGLIKKINNPPLPIIAPMIIGSGSLLFSFITKIRTLPHIR